MHKSGVVFMAIKSVSIRIEEEMLNKIAYVASYEGRSINSHVLILVRNSIKEFESENGKIPIGKPVDPENNVIPYKNK